MKGGTSYEISNKTGGGNPAALDPVRVRSVRGDDQPGARIEQDRGDDQRPKEVTSELDRDPRPGLIPDSNRAAGRDPDGVLSGPEAGGNLSIPTGAPVAESVGNRVENAPFPLTSPLNSPPVENNENPPVAPTGGKSLQVEETTEGYSASEIQWETVGIDSIKSSKNTWCFRLRWTNPDGSRPQIRLMNVSDQVYRSITRNRRNYAAFKKQLISGYQSAVRADQEPV